MTESTYAYGIRNEEKLIDKLSGLKLFSGLNKVPGSGNKFFAKEDLVGDTVLLQVKSTKSECYSLQFKDFKKLEMNAIRFDKIPVFVVRFTKQKRDIFFLNRNRSAHYSGMISDTSGFSLAETKTCCFFSENLTYVVGSNEYWGLAIEHFS